jgi:hypothetical protein
MSIDLDAIEARAKAATPGPWEVDSLAIAEVVTGDCESVALCAERKEWAEANRETHTAQRDGRRRNAAFIAAAREDVPALCAEARRLTDENAALRALLREARHDLVRGVVMNNALLARIDAALEAKYRAREGVAVTRPLTRDDIKPGTRVRRWARTILLLRGAP